ncbi:MAG: BREX-2 system adenine-specific DNA-methyltransferase PglX [Deltaproteobacteria bacterium]|nr:BREX-2 system adenine-specific DNA-methyltransferase PglX [Deltaproteobacteria bacterium]
MARGKKKGAAERPGLTDPTAPLDGGELLAAARPVLNLLREDLGTRAEDPAVAQALAARYEDEKQARHTADSFGEWREGLLAQVAASWFLSCVFVRTFEDRGLLGQARLAGPGATDSQTLFLQLAPSLTERDYLLFVFRELAELPAAGPLFDREHALVWQLSPSADAAKELLRVFRTPSADAPAFRFGQTSTRFLGDLYQDLYEDVRKRYALLQTPDFIESFILDRTLEPAITRFGLDDTTLIDPTCGSGHFLLGAFDRLFEHRLRAEPGIDVGQAAHKALDAVYGADINPYAIAIARVRLTLSYLEKAGIRRLKDAPKLPLHLAVADSLLHNPQHVQKSFHHLGGESSAAWSGDSFRLEDEQAARAVLYRQHAAVVGNPPYGDASNRALKDLYRSLYRSASGRFTLAAPFVEVCLDQCRDNGFVGLINSMAFANKLYGKPLIEDVLSGVDVTHVLSTAGVYFPPPGFSVATGIFFARKREPSQHLQVLRQVAPDPGQYENPSDGIAWRALQAHADDDAYEDEYIQVRRSPRSAVATYPWKLLAGPGDGIAERLESIDTVSLASLCTRVGIGPAAMSNADQLFQVEADHWIAQLEPDWYRLHLTGEAIRDYVIDASEVVYWPYDEELVLREMASGSLIERWLHPHKGRLSRRATFDGGTYASDPRRVWYQWHQVTEARSKASRRVVFPELLTEMHVVRVAGDVSISQSLMCFVPRDEISDDIFCSLLAFMNSSTMTAWVKSRCAPVGTARGDVSTEKGKAERFRLPANMAATVPVPAAVVTRGMLSDRLALFYRELEKIGRERVDARRDAVDSLAQGASGNVLDEWMLVERRLLGKSVVLQEEIDWTVYSCVSDTSIPLAPDAAVLRGLARAEERPAFGDFSTLQGDDSLRDVWRARRVIVADDALISGVENTRCKRSWLGRRGVFGMNRLSNDELAEGFRKRALRRRVLEAFSHVPAEARRLSTLRGEAAGDAFSALDLRFEIEGSSVPYLSAQVLSAEGLMRLNGQRGESEFERDDFVADSYWRLRGSWNVPGEHFISYPGCESDEDGEPLYGWAGWDHLKRAQALGALYHKRRTEEGWTTGRLAPMLAGILELLPWLKRWYNDPDPELGERMGDFFELYLDSECAVLGLSRDDLRAWRPTKKTSGSFAKPADGLEPRSQDHAADAEASGSDLVSTAATPVRSRRTRSKKPKTS